MRGRRTAGISRACPACLPQAKSTLSSAQLTQSVVFGTGSSRHSFSTAASAMPTTDSGRKRSVRWRPASPADTEEHQHLISHLEQFKGTKMPGLHKRDRELAAAVTRLAELQRRGVAFTARDFMLTFQACRAGACAETALSIVQTMPQLATCKVTAR